VRGQDRVGVPTQAELDAAATLIAEHLRPTPLVAVAEFGDGVFLKLESLQPTGAYKVRGALNALRSVPDDSRVVTGSGGNHALALAWAGNVMGGRAVHIVVPVNASTAKLDALKRLGADYELHGESIYEAEEHAIHLADAGAVYISPYNDRAVIAGQATIGYELDRQLSGRVRLVVPVGGGGLISGVGLWASTRPHTTVIGVEADASKQVSAAVAAGKVVHVPVRASLADALVGELDFGAVTPPIAGRTADRFLSVSEAELAAAVRFLALRCGLVVEGAGAAGAAALLAGHLGPIEDDEQLVIVITGRNIAADQLCGLL
jgi:threonine dehydratase